MYRFTKGKLKSVDEFVLIGAVCPTNGTLSVSEAVIEHRDQKKLGKEKAYLAHMSDPSLSLGAAKAAPGSEAVEACFVLPTARSPSFLL